MPVISAVALKGGCAKTTTIHNLAGTLGLQGHRVLAVDNDPQASLSSGMLGAGAIEQLDPSATIASIYAGDDPMPRKVIRPSGLDRVDILPGSMAAGRFNLPEPYLRPAAEQRLLRSFLAEVRDDYDWILIDNPPNLQAANWGAMVASDYLLIPVVPEDYGAASLSPVLESIGLVASGANPRVTLLGLVLTMVQPRLGVHQLYEATLRQIHGPGVFDSRIPTAADIKEAIALRRPVCQHKPKGASSKAFAALAAEVQSRIASLQAGNTTQAEAA